MDILQREKQEENRGSAFVRSANEMWKGMSKKIGRKINDAHFQRTVAVTAFFMIASYISYRVEAKYDRMRQRASRTKTFKEEQVERENEYITKYLDNNKFESVPIQE